MLLKNALKIKWWEKDFSWISKNAELFSSVENIDKLIESVEKEN